MKKLAIILVILLVLAGGVVYYVLMNAPSLAKEAIEEYAPIYIGAPITIGEMDWSDGFRGLVVRDFVLGNPPGFEGSHVIRIGHARVDLDLTRTWFDTVWIRRIEVDGADVAVTVGNMVDTNVQEIVDHAERVAMDPDEVEVEEEAEEDIRIVIDRLDFTNATASLSTPVFSLDAIEMPDVHLRDIDHTDVGATMADVAEQLLRPVLESVLRKYVDASPEELLAKLRDRLQDLEGKIDVESLKQKLEEKLNVDALKEKIDVDAIKEKVDVDALGEKLGIDDLGEKLNVDGLGEKLNADDLGEKLNADDLGEKLNVDDLGEKLNADDLGEKLNVDDLGEKLNVDDLGEKLNVDNVSEKLGDLLNSNTADQETANTEAEDQEAEEEPGSEESETTEEKAEEKIDEAKDKLKKLFKRP